MGNNHSEQEQQKEKVSSWGQGIEKENLKETEVPHKTDTERCNYKTKIKHSTPPSSNHFKPVPPHLFKGIPDFTVSMGQGPFCPLQPTTSPTDAGTESPTITHSVPTFSAVPSPPKKEQREHCVPNISWDLQTEKYVQQQDPPPQFTSLPKPLQNPSTATSAPPPCQNEELDVTSQKTTPKPLITPKPPITEQRHATNQIIKVNSEPPEILCPNPIPLTAPTRVKVPPKTQPSVKISPSTASLNNVRTGAPSGDSCSRSITDTTDISEISSPSLKVPPNFVLSKKTIAQIEFR